MDIWFIYKNNQNEINRKLMEDLKKKKKIGHILKFLKRNFQDSKYHFIWDKVMNKHLITSKELLQASPASPTMTDIVHILKR